MQTVDIREDGTYSYDYEGYDFLRFSQGKVVKRVTLTSEQYRDVELARANAIHRELQRCRKKSFLGLIFSTIERDVFEYEPYIRQVLEKVESKGKDVKAQKIEPNEEYLSSAILIILGDDLDPEMVSHMLSLEPSHAWRKGQKNVVALPDGSKRVFDSRAKWGGWKRFVDARYKDALLEAQLQYWIETLQDRTDAIAELKSQGMQCILDLFITTDGTATIDLSEEMQRSLASLGLKIEISIMTGPEHEQHDSSSP